MSGSGRFDNTVRHSKVRLRTPFCIPCANPISGTAPASRPEFRLIPMGADRFMVESLDYFRLQFRRDSSGKVNHPFP